MSYSCGKLGRTFVWHPFVMEMAAILVHSLNRFSCAPKMAAVAVAKLLLCCDIICNALLVHVPANHTATGASFLCEENNRSSISWLAGESC